MATVFTDAFINLALNRAAPSFPVSLGVKGKEGVMNAL